MPTRLVACDLREVDYDFRELTLILLLGSDCN